MLLTDHRQRPLTVVDVARLRLDDAGLAFLSACSTARPGGRLADEAIHLASAFQLAGYRHVIATLWPIGDQHAVDIADDIYTTLTTTGEGRRGRCGAYRRPADAPTVGPGRAIGVGLPHPRRRLTQTRHAACNTPPTPDRRDDTPKETDGRRRRGDRGRPGDPPLPRPT